MKKFSKILSVALLVALVLSLGVANAFADPGDTASGESGEPETPAATTKTITLTGGKAGHTYTLYQVFTGKTTETDGELTDIQWGSDVTDTFKATKDTAAAYAKEIADSADARATAQALIANNALTGGTAKTLTTDGTVVFDGLAEGYYIVIDTNGNVNPIEGDYSSAVIVQVVKNVEMKLKGDGATSDKKVKDINDSTGDESEYQDSADYDIGDAVPFQLTATTANNVAAYKKYHVTFQDTQSEGLDNPTSWTVTVLGKTFTLNAETTTANDTTNKGTKITVEKITPAQGKTFAIKVTFEPTAENAVYLDAECNSTTITVDYSSVLNQNAKLGVEGNPNTSNILYSNNPEDEDDSDEGKTPDKTVVVFTYKTVVDKIDETGAALKGAQFVLYKEVANSSVTGAKQGSAITFADGVEHSKIDAEKYYVEAGIKTVNDEVQFDFKGIDDGTYVLVETVVPVGYNPFQSVEFTVSATHTGNPKTLTLEGTAPFTNANSTTGNVDVDKKNGDKHAEVPGELYTEVENNSGTVLPSTGGIGTTIFYVVGGVLVLAAIILLVTKKRMSE